MHRAGLQLAGQEEYAMNKEVFEQRTRLSHSASFEAKVTAPAQRVDKTRAVRKRKAR